ncbi:MAG TPA: hypothetical protein VNA66_11525, partial [Gammaproteobacteria bacterium]|nr:hypothetical protein [Gammaproteobacteria bacterium]
MRIITLAVLGSVVSVAACSDLTTPDGPPLKPRATTPSFASAPVLARDADRAFNSKATDATDAGGAEGWSTIESQYPALRIVSDTSAPYSPSSVAQVTFPSGIRGGVTQAEVVKVFPTGGYKVVKLTIVTKLSSSWRGPQNGRSALGALTITGKTAMQLVADGAYSRTLRPVVVLGADLPDAREKLSANVDSGVTLTRNAWQRWDVEVQINTPGHADGRISWSLDGRVIGEYTDVQFTDSVAGSFDAYRQATIWGTTSDFLFTSMWIRYDNVTIDASATLTSDDATELPPTDPGATPPVRECDALSPAWIFCDDFESSRFYRYFSYQSNYGSFSRVLGAGIEASSGMR